MQTAERLAQDERTATASWPKRRMHHVFAPDGRAVVAALDHARGGNARGLERPAQVVAALVAGGIDAIMTTVGTARAASDALGRAGLILALDSEGPVADYGVELALRLGADAVELKVFPGGAGDGRLADLRRLAARCAEWGMPLLAEPIPVSFADTSAHTLENVGASARIGAEAGADFVKVHYVGPPEAYRRVVDCCPVPVLVLGGPRAEDPREALRAAAEAVAAGARGVVFGRNIYLHPEPARMAAALGEVVHAGASVEAAARVLQDTGGRG